MKDGLTPQVLFIHLGLVKFQLKKKLHPTKLGRLTIDLQVRIADAKQANGEILRPELWEVLALSD